MKVRKFLEQNLIICEKNENLNKVYDFKSKFIIHEKVRIRDVNYYYSTKISFGMKMI